jgi:hypothetical protein
LKKSVLAYFDSEKEIVIEYNVSDYIIGDILL